MNLSAKATRVALCVAALSPLGLLVAGSAVAADFDYPARKPGLWELVVDSGTVDAKVPAMTTQQCIDASSDKAMREMGGGMSKDMCSKQDMRRDGATLVVDSVCKLGNSVTATTHAVMTGDFTSNYRMESRSTYNPPLMGRAEGKATMQAKWVGPCKADQKPGDMVMSNGMKMNMLDMMGSRKK